MRTAAAVVAAALVAAACGGAGESADTTVPGTDAPPGTEAPETTTTVEATSTTSTTSTTIVPEDDVLRQPLTGQVVDDEADLETRPALAIKIDNNNSNARPNHSGLAVADIVYEEIVESGTRFAAVFHTQDSDPVGPVRSGREQDVAILSSLNSPLFGWSGGNPGVTRLIADSVLTDLNWQRNAGSYQRGPGRSPHDLYTATQTLYELTPDDHPGAPAQQFVYVAPDGEFEGVEVNRVDIDLDVTDVGWEWRDDAEGWLRFQEATTHAPRGSSWPTTSAATSSPPPCSTRSTRPTSRRWCSTAPTTGRSTSRSTSPECYRWHPCECRFGSDRTPGGVSTLTLMSETGTFPVKRGLAEMLKGGVIMDVVTPEQAKIAEDAGAVAVMALERVPADIRADGGVARMSDPEMIQGIQEVCSIPVMAKARIGHFVEAQILQALDVDFIDESEVLTPADEAYHIDKMAFDVPFVCGATNLGEALRRISEGAAMIRSKGEAGTGNVVEAVRHLRSIIGDMKRIGQADEAELFGWAKELQAPLPLVQEIAETGTLPVPLFCAGGLATPADAALAMQLGADAVFVGSGIFKSDDPSPRAKAIVEATTHYMDPHISTPSTRS